MTDNRKLYFEEEDFYEFSFKDIAEVVNSRIAQLLAEKEMEIAEYKGLHETATKMRSRIAELEETLAFAQKVNHSNTDVHLQDVREAMAKIQALEAENERLNQKLNERTTAMRENFGKYQGAQMEVAELRSATQKAVAYFRAVGFGEPLGCWERVDELEKAAALETPKPDKRDEIIKRLKNSMIGIASRPKQLHLRNEKQPQAIAEQTLAEIEKLEAE